MNRATKNEQHEVVLVLDNIRSTHNVGSIFRTADAAGVSKIYLCGVTPAPIDRFGRERNDVAKAALGAEKTVAWEEAGSTPEVIEKLKKSKFQIIALEQSDTSVDYKMVKVAGSTAIILGPEVTGMAAEVLSQCDIVAEIPMLGTKESLNVSVATGILLFRILNI